MSAPRRDDGSLVPALLAGVLALTLIAQFMVPNTVELPPPLVTGARVAAPMAGLEAYPRFVPALVVARNLFAPGRSQTGAVGKLTGAALQGAMVAGTLGTGARLRAVVVLPSGATVTIAPGGLVSGWQLLRLAPDHAEFQRGADKLTMPFGATIPQAVTNGEGADQ